MKWSKVRNGLVYAVADGSFESDHGTPVVYDLNAHKYVSTTGSRLDFKAANAANQWVGIDDSKSVAWSRTTGLVQLPHASATTSYEHPTYINDNGRVIAGISVTPAGLSQPVRWSCQ